MVTFSEMTISQVIEMMILMSGGDAVAGRPVGQHRADRRG